MTHPHAYTNHLPAEERDRAFAEALVELFKRYPIEEWMHESHRAVRESAFRAVRESAFRKARGGGYCDYAPGGMVRWRKQLEENATDWNIPPEEVIAVHLLIYG